MVIDGRCSWVGRIASAQDEPGLRFKQNVYVCGLLTHAVVNQTNVKPMHFVMQVKVHYTTSYQPEHTELLHASRSAITWVACAKTETPPPVLRRCGSETQTTHF